MFNWFGLPSDEDLKHPGDMPEEYWAKVFDAHMKRHDAFFWGILIGFFVSAILSAILCLFSKG